MTEMQQSKRCTITLFNEIPRYYYLLKLRAWNAFLSRLTPTSKGFIIYLFQVDQDPRRDYTVMRTED